MNIDKVEVTSMNVQLTLSNGVTVNISSNDGYLHLGFSGIDYDDGIVATPFAHDDVINTRLCLSNYIDIEYKPKVR